MLKLQQNGQGARSRTTALAYVPNKDVYLSGTQTDRLFHSLSKQILLLKPHN